jgi:drug/metabolite transporter (DMT)-like permease
VAVLIGLLVAIAFGSGDFLGARASQRASTPGVLLVAQVSALTGAVLVATLISAAVTGRDLAFGAIAGSANVLGLALLYHGLAHGQMSTVAPVTAVVGAIVPVSWGLIEGERPSALVLVGVACAVAAGALLAREEDDRPKVGGRSQVLVAVAAGAALGTSFILFAKTSSGSGYWPVLSARLAAVVLVGLVVLVLARTASVTFPAGRDRALALGAGALDVLATTLLVIAVRRELAVVVAPIASLAPGMTVVLAWQVLHERIGRSQLVGLGVAGLGLILIASG